LLGHVYGTNHYPRNTFTKFISQSAHLGVQIFFVISGFLITTLLLKEHERTGRINLPRFFLRRTLRIFPAAFAYIAIVAIVARPHFLVYALTYTMCYAPQTRPWILGHLWSLSVEEQFYLLWPVALLLGFRYRVKIGIAVVLLAPFARLAFWKAGLHEIDEYFPAVCDSLMMGCLLAFFYPRLRTRYRALLDVEIFTALGVLVLASQWLMSRVRIQIAFGAFVPFAIALFLFIAIERADWFLNNRLTRTVGVLSYSLYLWQQPFLNRTHAAWWTTFPLNLVLAGCCALLSFYLVERPYLSRHSAPKQEPAATEARVEELAPHTS